MVVDKVWPSVAVPDKTGATVLDGAIPAITAVAVETAEAEPKELVAVT